MICTTELRFHPVNESIIEAQTYLYYIQTPLSRPAEGVWEPYNEQTEQSLLEDFKRLWATSFLDNLWIETLDGTFPNGVAGKRVIYHMEERPRVKIVDYTGSSKVERTKIDEKMKELGIALRLDSFLDQAVVRRVQGLVKSFMAEKGYEFAEVTSTVEPLPAGPKLVKVVFDVKEGPKVKVRTIDFNGNTDVSDGTLAKQMKSTKAHRHVLVDHRQGHLQPEQVRRRRRKGDRVLPQQGLHQPRASASPRSRCSKTARTRKRAGSS